MHKEENLYTGSLVYKEIEFSFVFDRRNLKLIPPKDKIDIIESEWIRTEIGKGVYIPADPIIVKDVYIQGECYETGSKIVFLPETGSVLSFSNSVIRISLVAYIIFGCVKAKIRKMIFTCPEISYIHPVKKALDFYRDQNRSKDFISIKFNNSDNTSTSAQAFKVSNRDVQVHFGISSSLALHNKETPLVLKSSMIFDFEATDDYVLLMKLWRTARDFIRYLCYRNNICFSQIKLCTSTIQREYSTVAEMHIIENVMEEPEAAIQGRYIKQKYISGHEGQILTDIANNNLYMRHIPESRRAGQIFDAARFIMITAAFEWEFNRLHPNGITKSRSTVTAENDVIDEIERMIKQNRGKKKEIYRFLKKLVRMDSFQSKVIQVGRDYGDIISIFGNSLYNSNHQSLNYSEMGKRLADQRNHYAHGDLEKDFIGLSLLDLVYMQYIVYALQLHNYGLDNLSIQQSINDLFHLNVNI